MDATFLGLVETGEANVWELPVSNGLTGGIGQLFGGCVLGSAVGLVSQATGQLPAWATTQFAASATVGDKVNLRMNTVASGRSITQANVVGTVDDRHHSTTLVAVGSKTFPDQSPSRAMPSTASPDGCEPLDFDPGQGGLNQRVDVRSTHKSQTERRSTTMLWFRFHGTTSGDPYSIAIAADFFPPSLSAAIGRRVFGASLDNTIRFIDHAESEWLLVEMTVDSVQHGIAHGTSYVWSEDGRLLAIASQTCAVSEFNRR